MYLDCQPLESISLGFLRAMPEKTRGSGGMHPPNFLRRGSPQTPFPALLRNVFLSKGLVNRSSFHAYFPLKTKF